MKNPLLLMAITGLSLFTACGGDDDAPPAAVPAARANIELDLREDLAELSDSYVYEGWIVVDGAPISTGRFTKTDKSQTFSVLKTNWTKATEFILSVELKTGDDPAPSDLKIFKAPFVGDLGEISVNDVIADFSNASGEFVLAAPTSADPVADAKSGIWFIKGTGPGLSLPVLKAGWIYEGWVIGTDSDGKDLPLSTGKFSDPSAPDLANDFVGPNPANEPPFPGEDFLQEPSTYDVDTTFPVDLSGRTVVISIEPVVDADKKEPFFLKPMTGEATNFNGAANVLSLKTTTFPRGDILKTD